MKHNILMQIIREARNGLRWGIWNFQLFQKVFHVEYCGKRTYAVFTNLDGAEVAIAHFVI